MSTETAKLPGRPCYFVGFLSEPMPGPPIMAGALLAYWEGVHGKYPMLCSGGLMGGGWLTALFAHARRQESPIAAA